MNCVTEVIGEGYEKGASAVKNAYCFFTGFLEVVKRWMPPRTPVTVSCLLDPGVHLGVFKTIRSSCTSRCW